jgi:hypothetical protein
VASSWPIFVSECKSRLSAIARSCYMGRAQWREKCHEQEALLQEVRAQSGECEARREQVEQENKWLRERIAELEMQLAQPQPVQVRLGEAPNGQQYGAGMITLCVNLARRIGLRPAVHALQVVLDWLGAEVEIPTYQTMCLWMQRIGLDRMNHATKTDGGVWLTDHTNQIGKEKVLAVLRVPKAHLPRRGVPLRHEDVEVLMVRPGESWKREDVAQVYQEAVEQYGLPRAVGSDGAVELREPVESLGKPGHRPLVLRDPKHFLANKFEALLKRDPQYQAFANRLAGTRGAVQQTELAHFVPPVFKIKARFMNLQQTLDWATAVLWHLDHPQSKSRQGISPSRLEEKLGWLRDFAPSIRAWQACQEVVSTALTLLNEEGIFRGAAREFQNRVASHGRHRLSRQLIQTVVEFLRETEQQLRPGEHLPMSTEILESSFALYKQLEKQHSKSGFTGLLLTYPVLLRQTDVKEVRASFARTKVADVRRWTAEHLGSTFASKRQLMYREARTETKPNTQKRATRRLAAA